MTEPSWDDLPQAIHLAVGQQTTRWFVAKARAAGAGVIQLDLDGLGDKEDLVQRIASTFMFPYEVRGLDSVVDLVADLEWFGNERGYLVVVDAGDAVSAVLKMLGEVLPPIVAWWRTQSTPFVVVMDESAHDDDLATALARSNAELYEPIGAASEPPGIGEPVVVADHRIAAQST